MRSTLLVAVALGVGFAGCNPRKAGPGATGEQFNIIEDLNPAATIPATGKLSIGEVQIPVEVKQVLLGETLTYTIDAHGQTFETEVYEVKGDSFSLLDAAGEHYSPSLPLLKFPLTVGETWKWTGSMTAGEAPHKATATVSTTEESILLAPPLGTTPSILVVVDLSIENGAQKPATRKLRFWFVKKKGLLKRQFGSASSREPSE